MAKNMEIAFLVDFYGDMLTEKQRDMIELYYDDDLSLSEIAENEGITRQGVRDSIKRAESQLLEMEDRLGLARRFRTVRKPSAARRAKSDRSTARPAACAKSTSAPNTSFRWPSWLPNNLRPLIPTISAR